MIKSTIIKIYTVACDAPFCEHYYSVPVEEKYAVNLGFPYDVPWEVYQEKGWTALARQKEEAIPYLICPSCSEEIK